MKRLGFVVLAIFSILVVIGMVLDEDVQNASFRKWLQSWILMITTNGNRKRNS